MKSKFMVVSLFALMTGNVSCDIETSTSRNEGDLEEMPLAETKLSKFKSQVETKLRAAIKYADEHKLQVATVAGATLLTVAASVCGYKGWFGGKNAEGKELVATPRTWSNELDLGKGVVPGQVGGFRRSSSDSLSGAFTGAGYEAGSEGDSGSGVTNAAVSKSSSQDSVVESFVDGDGTLGASSSSNSVLSNVITQAFDLVGQEKSGADLVSLFNQILKLFNDHPNLAKVENSKGETLLHLNRYKYPAKLLLEKGALINKVSNEGKTPLDCAKELERSKVYIAFLTSKGAQAAADLNQD